MIIFPAIDIREGKCVRLFQGEYAKETVYGDDPVEMAKRFRDRGAAYLHAVDLDGARSGVGTNMRIIERIAKLGMKVQTGGGIRTRDDVKMRMECGAFRVVLGTAAVENPDLVGWAVQSYGDAVAVGIDAKDDTVSVRGWEMRSKIRPEELGLQMKNKGVKTVVFTRIERDGTRLGPDINACVVLARATGLCVVASGGVGKLSDIADAANAGLHGLIVGKALYEGDIDLSEALIYQSED